MEYEDVERGGGIWKGKIKGEKRDERNGLEKVSEEWKEVK